MPRSALKSWLIDRDPELIEKSAEGNFFLNVRHPVERLYSAFTLHAWFDPCKTNFTHCFPKPLMTRGPQRNKLVTELAGWYLPCEFGDVSYQNFVTDGKI